VSLRSVGTVAGPDTLDRAFAAGRLGCVISGASLPAMIARESRGMRYGVAALPTPTSDAPHVSWAAGHVLASFTQSKEKPLALELARFLARPENALAVAEATPGALPAAVGADSSAWFAARPGEQAMVWQLASAHALPSHSAWPSMEAVIDDEVAQALNQRKTVARASADPQARLEKLAAGS